MTESNEFCGWNCRLPGNVIKVEMNVPQMNEKCQLNVLINYNMLMFVQSIVGYLKLSTAININLLFSH